MVDTGNGKEAQQVAVILVIENANGERREIPVQRESLKAEGGIVIGRTSGAQVVVPSGFVSRTHCRLTADPAGTVLVTDLGSNNGTFVDGKRLGPDETAPLTEGTTLELGDVTINVQFPAPVASATVPPPTAAPPDSEGAWRVHTRSSGAREETHSMAGADLQREGGIVVGRNNTSADIRIVDPSVSRAHCRIQLDASGNLSVTDLGSSNGTVLAGSRLNPNEPTPFSPGDSIEVGNARISLAAPEASAVPDATVISGAPQPTPAPIPDATIVTGGNDRTVIGGGRTPPGDVIPDTTIVGGADKTVVGGGTPAATVVGRGMPGATVVGGGMPGATVVGGAPDATVVGGGLPGATVVGSGPDAGAATVVGGPPPSAGAGRAIGAAGPRPAMPPPAAQPAAGIATVAGARAPSPLLAAMGSLLIPAAVVIGPLLVLIGNQAVSLAAARYLVAAVVVAVIAYAGLGIYNEFRRERTARAFEALELDRLRNDVALTAARASLEQERTASAWSGFRKYRVARKYLEGGDICSFYLVPHDGKPHPPFEPGQHITFQLKMPGRDKPVVRCYTLSDSPSVKDYYRVSIKRVPPPRDKPDVPPGLSSNFFHDMVHEGDILDVKAPSGKFFLDMSRNTPVVLIGGGIGLTPVLSMVNQIAASGSTRETWFFYGVRHGAEHIMKEHLETIARNNPNLHLQVCYSNPREGLDRPDIDFQHSERVSVDLFKRVLPSSNYEYYICGPPPMMESVVGDLEAWGVPESAIHFEAFGPATVKKTKQKEPAATPAVQASVTFSKSEKTVAWTGEFDSILEFAEANGITMDSGCRAGNCGSCMCALKAGRVRYIEAPGLEPDGGSCLTCISVPDGDLVLEA